MLFDRLLLMNRFTWILAAFTIGSLHGDVAPIFEGRFDVSISQIDQVVVGGAPSLAILYKAR